jgi:hypothetical protein
MSAYKHALAIDDTSSADSLSSAAEALNHCDDVVLLHDVVALRPAPDAIYCEVLDPMPGAHRCAEEFKVLIENAERCLFKSKLSSLLPSKPLKWLVVRDDGDKVVELWPVT